MQNIYQLKNFESRKLPAKFYSGLTSLLHQLGIDGNDVVEDFISQYVNYAYKQNKTKSSVYLSTGFSRHIVKKYLAKKRGFDNYKKRDLYLGLLIAELKRLAKQYKGGLIPIYGKFGSYTSAFNNTKASDNIITSKTMLDNLINAGILNKKEGKVRFLTQLQPKGLFTIDSITNTLSDLMSRLTKTILHNLKAKSNDDTLFQMSYISNSIRSNKRKELTDGLRKLARQHFREYQNLIDSYEEKGLCQQEVEDLNNEIGISAFIFNNDNTEV